MNELEKELSRLPQTPVDASLDARMQELFKSVEANKPVSRGVPLWVALAACFVCLLIGMALPDARDTKVVATEEAVPPAPAPNPIVSQPEAVLVKLRLGESSSLFSPSAMDDRPWYEKPVKMVSNP